ncbi:MAG: hypothetical protein EA349_14050 [Halomonadaceae bacterium]|nr:MAG: hypothetical protein EA349_14050 [Halomonadaceae bacterium]
MAKWYGFAVFMLTVVVSGCASQSQQPLEGEPITGASEAGQLQCGPKLTGDAAMHLDLIREMARQQQYRAALAHLEALEASQVVLPAQAIRIRADSHRAQGEFEQASVLYRQLKTGCMPGMGHRGLGLIAAAEQDFDTAIEHLTQAARYRPVDARIRNDLGYAHLLKGNLDEARSHLQTAHELGDWERGSINLVLVNIIRGDYGEARRIAAQLEMNAAKWEALGREAETFR